jgi:SAM-dependent methyltransferase
VSPWREASSGRSASDELHAEFERYNSERYHSFSLLLRTSFEEALGWFADESIDLLHIERAHSNGVSHDFEAWFPKVAPGGVVLLPRVMQELSNAHDSFEFHHAGGLGVIRKRGGDRHHGGILEYLFTAANAEGIRRYYLLCAERLDAREAANPPTEAPARERDSGQVYVDPGNPAIEALTGSPNAGCREGDFLPLPLDSSASKKTDWTPVEDKPDTWVAATADPQFTCVVGFDPSVIRFFVFVMGCVCEEANPSAQLFWAGKERAGFQERLSVCVPLIADGRPHGYVVDLHAGAAPGDVNHLWWHRGAIDEVRFDPLDMPGEFAISLAGFAPQDRTEAIGVRQELGMPPLQAELSSRHLRGHGIEIGALQNPLPLRPDAYVDYADRLTPDEARAAFPEIRGNGLVIPKIIPAASALGSIPDGRFDFVIANHSLERLKDPLAGLGEWIRIARPGAHLYVAASAHTNSLNRLREVTPLDHLVADFKEREQREEFDRQHYREWVACAHSNLSDRQRESREAELALRDYEIPLHVFNEETFSGLLRIAGSYFPVTVVELRRTYGAVLNEYIAILRRQ